MVSFTGLGNPEPTPFIKSKNNKRDRCETVLTNGVECAMLF